jgi:hypothetical protein
MQLFVSWSLSVYTLNQVACFMQFVYKLFSPKWRILTMKTLSYKLRRLSGHLFLWPNNITTFFSFPAMFYLPCTDHVLLFVDVVTSWPQTKISDWSEIKLSWSLLYIIEHVLSQSVYHATSKSCIIQSNSTVYTVFFGLW